MGIKGRVGGALCAASLGVVATIAVGCGSSSSGPGSSPDDASASDSSLVADVASGDASAGDASSDDAGSVAQPDSAACNQVLTDAHAACFALCNGGPVVSVLFSIQAAPTPMGGAVVPGLYYLTAATEYFGTDAGVDAGASGATRQKTALITGPDPVGVDQVISSANGGPNDTTQFEFSVSGTSIDVTETCPQAGQSTVQYTATPTQIHSYSEGSGARGSFVSEEVYTLQTALDAGAPPADSGASDAGCAQALSDSQVACNSICNAGPVVPVVGVAGVAPTPAGGTIADGTYYLTAETSYGGADSGADGGTLFDKQQTLVISTSDGISIWQAIELDNGVNDTLTVSAVAQDSTVYLTGLCPSAMQGTQGFTVNGTQLDLFQMNNGDIIESVFTKQ